jgi:hypothetical protein
MRANVLMTPIHGGGVKGSGYFDFFGELIERDGGRIRRFGYLDRDQGEIDAI